MKLSFILELLLIFVFLAFAASRVIDSEGRRHLHHARKAVAHSSNKVSHKNRQSEQNENPNRYCSCGAKLCKCCRVFNIPAVALQGPGCASLQYLNGDKLAISMSFGQRVLINRTTSGRRPDPICMPLPGGVSKFCGRLYNIRPQGEDFNACLGLELRSLSDIEASLSVSCFKFGPDGIRVQPAQPLPAVAEESDDDDDDDDDDYEDDEDDFDFDDDEDDEEEDDNDVETADYESFSLLDDDFIDGLFVGEAESDAEGEDATPKPTKPLRKVVSTKAPAKKKVAKPTRKVATGKPLRKVTPKPTKPSTTAKPKATTSKNVLQEEIVTEKEPTQSNPTQPTPTKPNPTKSNSVQPSSDDVESSSIKAETTTSTVSIKTPALEPVQMIQVPEPVNISTNEIVQISNDMSNEIPVDVKINKTEKVTEIHNTPITITSYEATVQMVTDSTPIPFEETTVKVEDTTEDEYVEDNDEPEQSYIIKNEDEDDSEEDPLTSMVEDVLDDEEDVKSNLTKVEELKINVNSTDKKESKDVVDDVIDGVADIVSDDDDSEENSKDDDKHEDDDDDDIFDDDDEEDSEEDEEDEEDDARSLKFARVGTKNFRQSKDIRS